MITIIAAIYIFYLMWYFINSWKLVSENPQDHPPPDKSHPPHFYSVPPKSSKSASYPFSNIETFSGSPAESGDTRVHRSVLRKVTIDLLYFWEVYDINLLEKKIGRSTVYSCRTNAFI